MPDIFISYKRENREIASKMAQALSTLGYDVWYDFELLTGDPFRGVIRKIIDQSRAAIVIWSRLAVQSEFVLDEATYAKAKGKLFPVRIEDTDLPFGFGQTHTEDLTGWEGDSNHPGFQRLLRALQAKATPTAAERPAQSRDELAAFSKAITAGDLESIKTFIASYPDGSLIDVANAELKERSKLSSRWRRASLATKALTAGLAIGLAGFAINTVIQQSLDYQMNRDPSGYVEPLAPAELDRLTRQALQLAAQGKCSEEIMQARLLAACLSGAQDMQRGLSPLGSIVATRNEGRKRSATGAGWATRILVTFEQGSMHWEVNGGQDGKLVTFWSSGTTTP